MAREKAKRNPAIMMVTSLMLTCSFAAVWQVMAQTAKAGNAMQGKKYFADKCVRCHGDNGSGDTPLGKPLGAMDLRSAPVQALSNVQIFAQISKGKGNMPPFGGALNPTQIDDLIAYVREFGRHPAGKKSK